MIKINEMNPGKETVGFEAIIISVTVGKTNGANKSSYLNIVLQDATGTIDAKLWSATDEQIRLFERGQVVRGKGDIINYKGMRQMKIVKLEPIEMNAHDLLFVGWAEPEFVGCHGAHFGHAEDGFQPWPQLAHRLHGIDCILARHKIFALQFVANPHCILEV